MSYIDKYKCAWDPTNSPAPISLFLPCSSFTEERKNKEWEAGETLKHSSMRLDDK